MCGCLSRTPNQGAGPQPRHVPWLGIGLATLWFTARAQSTEPHQPEHMWNLLNLVCIFKLRVLFDSNAKSAPEIFDLYLYFIQLLVEKVDSHAHIIPNILTSFPMMESSFKNHFLNIFIYVVEHTYFRRNDLIVSSLSVSKLSI